MATNYQVYVARDQGVQRAVVAAVHEMFPRPVPYLERAGMIASFPNRSFFMSTWGLESYRAAGQPVLKQNTAKQAPVFLIATHAAVSQALQGKSSADGLVEADAAYLHDNFLPHWGPIWVAGRSLPAAAVEANIEIMAPGLYTLESAEPVAVDGVTRPPRAVLELASGKHRIGPHATAAQLRWGDHLTRPQSAAPVSELYSGF
jgi:hypothetical protein